MKQDRATYGLTGLPPSKQIEILKQLGLDVSPQTQEILRKPGIRICRRCWTRKGEFNFLPNGSRRYCPPCDKERRKEYGRDKSRWIQRKRRTVERIQRDVDYIQRRTRELMEKLAYLGEINEEIRKIHLKDYFLTSEFLKEMNRRHTIKKRLEVEVLRVRNQLYSRLLQLDQLSTTGRRKQLPRPPNGANGKSHSQKHRNS